MSAPPVPTSRMVSGRVGGSSRTGPSPAGLPSGCAAIASTARIDRRAPPSHRFARRRSRRLPTSVERSSSGPSSSSWTPDRRSIASGYPSVPPCPRRPRPVGITPTRSGTLSLDAPTGAPRPRPAARRPRVPGGRVAGVRRRRAGHLAGPEPRRPRDQRRRPPAPAPGPRRDHRRERQLRTDDQGRGPGVPGRARSAGRWRRPRGDLGCARHPAQDRLERSRGERAQDPPQREASARGSSSTGSTGPGRATRSPPSSATTA